MIGFLITFFPIFDVPVFWPILLMYWMVLLFVTMKRQIKHMIKYRYIPFSLGKKVPLLIPFAQSNPAVLLWCPTVAFHCACFQLYFCVWEQLNSSCPPTHAL